MTLFKFNSGRDEKEFFYGNALHSDGSSECWPAELDEADAVELLTRDEFREAFDKLLSKVDKLTERLGNAESKIDE